MMQTEHVKYLNTPASQCNNMCEDDAHNLHNITIKAMMKIRCQWLNCNVQYWANNMFYIWFTSGSNDKSSQSSLTHAQALHNNLQKTPQKHRIISMKYNMMEKVIYFNSYTQKVIYYIDSFHRLITDSVNHKIRIWSKRFTWNTWYTTSYKTRNKRYIQDFTHLQLL